MLPTSQVGQAIISILDHLYALEQSLRDKSVTRQTFVNTVQQ